MREQTDGPAIGNTARAARPGMTGFRLILSGLGPRLAGAALVAALLWSGFAWVVG